MSIQEDIEKFYDWATKVGCPHECLPTEDALKPIFKSRSRGLLINLMRRVQPVQNVSDIRDNIIINRMEKFKYQLIPSAGRNLLPQRLQNYLKVSELSNEKRKLEFQYKECKSEFDSTLEKFGSKNLKSLALERERDSLRTKVTLLRAKLDSMKDEIQLEEENRKKIMEVMPVQITAKNSKEQRASEAVQKAFAELNEFYKACSKDLSAVELKQCRDDLWKKMREIFQDIPNYFIYNVISRLKDEDLQYIIDLKKTNAQHNCSLATSRDCLYPFEEKLLETKIEAISIAAQCLRARDEHNEIDVKFTSDYHPFVESLRNQITHFNPNKNDQDEIDEVINDYIVQYHVYNFYTAQNDYLTQQIEFYRAELDSGAEYLHSHERLLNSIKETYVKINDSVNRIQYESLQLSQIKDKILYCKNLMQQKVSGFQRQNMKKWKKNDISSMSILTVDGFEPANESLFSSTKLDFDSSIVPVSNLTFNNRSFSSVADLTVLPSSANKVLTNNNMLPSKVMEISTFLDTPLQKLFRIPKECVFYLSPNPLVFESLEQEGVHLQLAPGSLLTAFGALREIKQTINWAELIAQLPNDLKFDQEIVSVDVNLFKDLKKKQHDQIIELLKKIDDTCNTTTHSIHELKRYYEFILDNPLKRYIPPTKQFLNQTYDKFEAEFLLYYRIVKGGS